LPSDKGEHRPPVPDVDQQLVEGLYGVADRHVAALRRPVGCPFHFEDLLDNAIRQVRLCQGDAGSRGNGVGRANHLWPQDGSQEPIEHLLELILPVHRGEVPEDLRGAPAQEGVVVFEQAHQGIPPRIQQIRRLFTHHFQGFGRAVSHAGSLGAKPLEERIDSFGCPGVAVFHTRVSAIKYTRRPGLLDRMRPIVAVCPNGVQVAARLLKAQQLFV
jgi:hypothetical protein